MAFFFTIPLRRRMKRVMRSGLFDQTWYAETYAALIPKGIDPLKHYVTAGEQAGLKANRYFDPAYYLAQLRAARWDGLALLHYSREGWTVGLNPSSDFSATGYFAANPHIKNRAQDPLKHYLTYGAFEGAVAPTVAEARPKWARRGDYKIESLWEGFRQKMTAEDIALWDQISLSGLFDPDWYKQTYMTADSLPRNPLLSFIWTGLKKDHNPNALFDSRWYKETHSLEQDSTVAVLDYLSAGTAFLRDPGPDFSTEIYTGLFPFAAETDLTPLGHFLTREDDLGDFVPKPGCVSSEDLIKTDAQRAAYNLVRGADLVDEDWYKDRYQASDDPVPALTHYITRGMASNHPPNAFFDLDWYRQTYSAEIGDRHPVLDYAEAGHLGQRDPSPHFSSAAYLALDPELKASGENPLGHYLTVGRAAGQPLPSHAALAATKPAVAGSTLPVIKPLRGALDWAAKDLEPVQAFDPDRMQIHWVIPDFAAGGGGHMTIFRMIHALDVKGHKQTVWINNPAEGRTAETGFDDIQRHFQHFAGTLKLLNPDFPAVARGDAIIATDYASVYPVMAAPNFSRRFYFVQDFEPAFAPMGAQYLMAENTYRQDLDCLCASPWLQTLMETRYGRHAISFMLAADTKLYHPPTQDPRPRTSGPLRIAVYARHFTERRAVELAFLGLEALANEGAAFEVDFFGADLDFHEAPFAFRTHGIAKPDALADLFRAADIGLVFSATNYSLVPQEMMAAGLPVIELETESTRAIFPPDTVSFAAPDPQSIANTVMRLLKSPDTRATQAQAARNWVSQFSWDGAADMIEKSLQERTALFAPTHHRASVPATLASGPKASIVIPTWNAGPRFQEVLQAVRGQKAPWAFDILVIDSGSEDGTLDYVQACPDVRLHQIPQSSFDHGETRNLGVHLTEGDFIAFLTHDALPYNDRWLFNLVTAVDSRGPKAAGGIGKHLAWPDASPFTKRDMKNHFEALDRHPLAVNRDTDRAAFEDPDNLQWRQFLHFYSDNNSCLRRSVWTDIPYPKTQFGEDQIWADTIIKAGYTKVYAPQAIVYHSHDYDADETYERQKTESAFFKHFFGYILLKDEAQLAKVLESVNAADREWGLKEGLSEDEIAIRLALNEARLKGTLAGAHMQTDGVFE